MDLFKRFGCNHTQSRLQRQPISKQSFNLGLPGLNPIVSINGPQANYVYYCPTCQSKLPLSENSRWKLFIVLLTQNQLRQPSLQPEQKPKVQAPVVVNINVSRLGLNCAMIF